MATRFYGFFLPEVVILVLEGSEKTLSETFIEICTSMLDLNFSAIRDNEISIDDSIYISIGVSMDCDDKIIFVTDKNIAREISIRILGEEVSCKKEIYLCVAEFFNIFLGKFVTDVNNIKSQRVLTIKTPHEASFLEISNIPEMNKTSIYFESVWGRASIVMVF